MTSCAFLSLISSVVVGYIIANITANFSLNIRRKLFTKVNDFSLEEIKKFRFDNQNFENIEPEANNLLVANFSIPFCNKDCFYSLWDKITKSILENRIFCWKFFWIK